ncbi:HNH endonuclease signature motif containing protein [Microbacterium plantarum]|uniref:HNH endonuclease n=1 Tax=Microbacterium plantarum TaxID=1816425 RepID=A0ABV5EP22_9MICO
MSANAGGGSGGVEVLPHAHAIAAYGETLVLVHRAEVASVRALAELGRSALREARRDGVRGMASDMELRSVAAEAAGLARRTDRRLQADIDHALTVVDDYPTVFSAWQERRITRDHVDAVVKAGTGLPDEVRGEFEVAAIAVCERDIATRVKPALRALAERLHERTFTDRHREAAAGRCVRVSHGTDGMSDVIATVPTVIAVGMLDRLTQMGQSVKDARADAAGPCEPADTRTMDQLRADILGDLVLGGAPVVDPTYGTNRDGGLGAIRARVQVAVTAETLMGRDENPAEAVGAALIDADTARELAGQVSEWDRLFIDPVTRTPVEIDTYRPTASMKKLLMARDQHCRFPGCRRAAIRCELDHTIDHALGGHTHVFNLAHLCQRHHSMKQFTKWEVRQVGGGVLEWTSPLGRVYREDVPIPAVCFTIDTADPPPDAALGGPPPGEAAPF